MDKALEYEKRLRSLRGLLLDIPLVSEHRRQLAEYIRTIEKEYSKVLAEKTEGVKA